MLIFSQKADDNLASLVKAVDEVRAAGLYRQLWQSFAILTPIGFAAVIAVMVLPKLGIRGGWPELKGGDAAALVGGMGTALMILATLAAEGARKSLDVCADHITDGVNVRGIGLIVGIDLEPLAVIG